jgi:hypothetical protein
MNSALLLGVVLLATFGAAALLLSALVATAWRAGLRRVRTSAADLLTLRLLPVTGALLFALTVVLPAFLSREPHRDREAAGPLLLMLAAFALVTLGHGLWRGWRTWAATRSLVQACGATDRCVVENGSTVHIVDTAEPIIGVIGAWRPRVITAERVVSACSPDEFRQVVAHEAAHVSSRDNLKLLMLLACPDALAWTGLGPALTQCWRNEAEFAADQRATGDDPQRRLDLAAALIKVSRLVDAGVSARHALSMSVAMDNVEGRVRQLLAPTRITSTGLSGTLAAIALLVPVAGLPLYALIHELIETLVRFGL